MNNTVPYILRHNNLRTGLSTAHFYGGWVRSTYLYVTRDLELLLPVDVESSGSVATASARTRPGSVGGSPDVMLTRHNLFLGVYDR